MSKINIRNVCELDGVSVDSSRCRPLGPLGVLGGVRRGRNGGQCAILPVRELANKAWCEGQKVSARHYPRAGTLSAMNHHTVHVSAGTLIATTFICTFESTSSQLPLVEHIRREP